jgi:FeS assembly SUF system protein
METQALDNTESEATGTEAAAPATGTEAIKERIVETIQTVYDPEIPVDIYQLGLIYDIAVADDGKVDIKMTLTSPACPAAGVLPGEVEMKVRGVEGVSDVDLEIVWDPVWNPSMMSEAARLELGML